ncbi:MAG: MBL fold metallo-hydrolase [Bacteroidales bacterium]|jgi:7,8-dihydropterin-6-yl-methyl-4-(beta-D-ribofuranosyl)aminobenzene 5'-phosphate synthase|nr:MBL fold metallo-hydrolase [Bacteroidales bacterium]MDY0196223.1 MBL fold metallo-hydrolase [Tenuifilaceae bacterium]
MKISVLVDNTPGPNTLAEHGLSYLIDYNGKQILFDTGQTDLFLRNAEIMNLNTKNVDQIVLSHGHFDHGNGLNHIHGGNLICHPGCFVKRHRKDGDSYIGLKNNFDSIRDKFNLFATAKPYQIFSGAYFLGEIPRISDFESKTTSFVFDDGTPDFVMDDSALAFRVDSGIFVITGCGHAGIVNTLEYAKKATGQSKIVGIMGGFHLKENNLQTQKTIEYLKANNVKYVYPSHCTAAPALAEFYKIFKTPQVKTGDILTIH